MYSGTVSHAKGAVKAAKHALHADANRPPPNATQPANGVALKMRVGETDLTK